jgi:hypothetical protein
MRLLLTVNQNNDQELDQATDIINYCELQGWQVMPSWDTLGDLGYCMIRIYCDTHTAALDWFMLKYCDQITVY